MKKIEDQASFSLFSFLIHLLVLLQFFLNPVPREIYRDFFWQFYLLLGLSLLGSVLLSFVKMSRPYILPFRLLIILLISYPTGHYIWIGALLMITLTVETALYTPLPWGRILSIVCIIPLYFFQKERSAFYTPVAGASLPDMILLGWLPLLSGQAGILYHKKVIKNKELENLNKRLDLAATRLIDANLGYQNYARQLEFRTLNEERRRISREIHDSVGYGLTNVRVMLEAGAIQIDHKPEEAKKLILKAMDETRLCLEETRTSMRALRDRELPDYKGLAAINRLVQAFETSTGIEVNLELGEAPSLFPPEIDKIVYRMIQEAMTNAFRHGMASKVDIMFWYDRKKLQIMVRDNGRGAPTVKEGLGLTGMRERVESIGGTVEYGAEGVHSGGFQVRALIPFLAPRDRRVNPEEKKINQGENND